MDFDLKALLAPLADDAPAGLDRTYSLERIQIEEAFAENQDNVGASYVDGELVAREASAASGPDWRKITTLIRGESGCVRDLWLGVYLARAGARAGDLETVVDGLALTQGLLERWWETGWPSLEEDGPIARKTACASLETSTGFLRPLLAVPLIKHSRLGIFTGGDFMRFAASDGPSEDGYGPFRAAVQEADAEEMALLKARLLAGQTSLAAISQTLTGHLGGKDFNLKDSGEVFEGIIRALAVFTEGAAPIDAIADEDESGASAIAAKGSGGPGVIANRKDVIRALEAICEFYRRSEPSSPIPLVLKRARGWVELDFLQVLQDIAPGGASEARSVLSTREEN